MRLLGALLSRSDIGDLHSNCLKFRQNLPHNRDKTDCVRIVHLKTPLRGIIFAHGFPLWAFVLLNLNLDLHRGWLCYDSPIMAKLTAYIDALATAREELAEVEEQINPLNARKMRLMAIIQALAPEANQNGYTAAPMGLSALFATPTDQSPVPGPLWTIVRDLMRDYDSFGISLAAREVEKKAKLPLGPNRQQIVRNAIIRHPETFERLIDGYRVVQGDAKRKEANS
jgi:hypothetical protein